MTLRWLLNWTTMKKSLSCLRHAFVPQKWKPVCGCMSFITSSWYVSLATQRAHRLTSITSSVQFAMMRIDWEVGTKGEHQKVVYGCPILIKDVKDSCLPSVAHFVVYVWVILLGISWITLLILGAWDMVETWLRQGWGIVRLWSSQCTAVLGCNMQYLE